VSDSPQTRQHLHRLIDALADGDLDPAKRAIESLRPANPSENALSEILERNSYDTDKSEYYLRNYERKFAHLRERPIALLEVGVHRGGSLYLWRDYFSRGTIVGFDLHPPASFSDESGRIRIFPCDQGNAPGIRAAARSASPDGFDIIIDDASHMGTLTAITFQTLFYDHLRPGGFYAIEDWGTGYWDRWPDGGAPLMVAAPHFSNQGKRFPSHDLGMVGFVKQLLDEGALADVFHPRFGGPPTRKCWIRDIQVNPGLVIVEKASV